jgi:hypothetical protein
MPAGLASPRFGLDTDEIDTDEIDTDEIEPLKQFIGYASAPLHASGVLL